MYKRQEQAKQLQELLCGFDTDAKIVERKGHYVVYIKEGAHIVDSLNIMEAYVSLMKLENAVSYTHLWHGRTEAA